LLATETASSCGTRERNSQRWRARRDSRARTADTTSVSTSGWHGPMNSDSAEWDTRQESNLRRLRSERHGQTGCGGWTCTTADRSMRLRTAICATPQKEMVPREVLAPSSLPLQGSACAVSAIEANLVHPARLELVRSRHNPLKIACLPIPPRAHGCSPPPTVRWSGELERANGVEPSHAPLATMPRTMRARDLVAAAGLAPATSEFQARPSAADLRPGASRPRRDLGVTGSACTSYRGVTARRLSPSPSATTLVERIGIAATPVASVARLAADLRLERSASGLTVRFPHPVGLSAKTSWSGVRESNPPLLLGRQRPRAARPTPLESRASCVALRLPVSMRRIVACAGLWAGGGFGWSESGTRALVTCLPPALRRGQGQSELDRVDSGQKLPEQHLRPRRAMAACRGTRIECFSDCSDHGVRFLRAVNSEVKLDVTLWCEPTTQASKAIGGRWLRTTTTRPRPAH
jgi:hypothetical protein